MELDLNTIWFALVGVLFTGYVVLDGFDLGVGALHLFARADRDRRTLLNAIGPVWDGNEVWLITAGGALFAAFPRVYACVFSGFYMAFMLLLLGLIFRAVAIEFRSKRDAKWWRSLWDVSFSISSIASSFIVGVALGNIVWGVRLTAEGDMIASFWDLFHPYAVIVGLLAVALFSMHGAIYLLLKTESDLHNRVRVWARNAIICFVLCYVAATLVTLLRVPYMTGPFRHVPGLLVIPILNVLAIANIVREILRGRDFRAFLSSCAVIVLMMALFGVGMYPDMVICDADPGYSLSIYNAASSAKTLTVMLIMASVGMPLVIAYTAGIYWVFRGKVRLDETSY